MADRTCSVDDCEQTASVRGWCNRHYQRWYKHGENLCVDHDHVTGTVRGLLCNGCNHGIGKLGDNAEGVRRALAYLEAAEHHAGHA